jgi:hypothetical protein
LTLIWDGLSALAAGAPPAEPPTEWIDPATGHRVVRLSREPGSDNLYFHQYAYSADGQKLLISTPSGLATVNLKTREIDQVVTGRVNVLVVGGSRGKFITRRAASYTPPTFQLTRPGRLRNSRRIWNRPATSPSMPMRRSLSVSPLIRQESRSPSNYRPANQAADSVSAGLPERRWFFTPSTSRAAQ